MFIARYPVIENGKTDFRLIGLFPVVSAEVLEDLIDEHCDPHGIEFSAVWDFGISLKLGETDLFSEWTEYDETQGDLGSLEVNHVGSLFLQCLYDKKRQWFSLDDALNSKLNSFQMFSAFFWLKPLDHFKP